ncbi:MAG: hypothetical protein KAG10_01260 [Methylococcales bacterium]|nr:hypothetical protein [Methylococcales bacterium]MCK5924500.1 hypothetical protein [Methylococcales bacterium]
MTEFIPLIICNDKNESNKTDSVFDFENKEIDLFGFTKEQALDSILSSILTDPKHLHTHLQRIYFCYQHDLNKELFAALIDFLIILKGKGLAVGHRMVNGAKPKLDETDYHSLQAALKLSADDIEWADGNLYSLFTQGLIGSPVLIHKETKKSTLPHDPLVIARDYVAYSQLDMAMKTLEEAIDQDFENATLHNELLELYKLTRSKDQFLTMYNDINKQSKTPPQAWDKLKVFFDE